MPTGSNGKTARSYTKGSEAINNVLVQTKESYLREQKKPETTQLSKLEFTKNIFEEVHRKQQEELTLAVIGLSDQYELSTIVAHLAVPAEVWFEWSVAQRKEYIAKFNSMSVKKTITVNDTIAERCTDREFYELSEESCKNLVSERGYGEEVALAVKEGALLLLNCPSAIQRLPTVDERKAQNKFEVDSKSAKHGRVECTVHAMYCVGAYVSRPIKLATLPEASLWRRKTKCFANTLNKFARAKVTKQKSSRELLLSSVCE